MYPFFLSWQLLSFSNWGFFFSLNSLNCLVVTVRVINFVNQFYVETMNLLLYIND